MAYTCFQTPWWLLPLQKKLLMCMNELPLTGGTNVLDILHLKLFKILSINYPFLFRQKKFHPYVLPVPQIKRINNLLVQQVFKVTLHLILYTLMCGVLLTLLDLWCTLLPSFHGPLYQIYMVLSNVCKISGV